MVEVKGVMRLCEEIGVVVCSAYEGGWMACGEQVEVERRGTGKTDLFTPAPSVGLDTFVASRKTGALGSEKAVTPRHWAA